jgi:hypothetical protein
MSLIFFFGRRWSGLRGRRGCPGSINGSVCPSGSTRPCYFFRVVFVGPQVKLKGWLWKSPVSPFCLFCCRSFFCSWSGASHDCSFVSWVEKRYFTTYQRRRKGPYRTATLGNDWITNRNNVKQVDLTGSIFDSPGNSLSYFGVYDRFGERLLMFTYL